MWPLRQRNGSRVIVSPPRETDGGFFYVKTQIGRPGGAVTFSTGDSRYPMGDIILDKFEVENLALTS
jgi:hypothetical protein